MAKQTSGEFYNKNEIIAQEWTNIRLLWESCRKQADPAVAEKIERLLTEEKKFSSGPEEWQALNIVEQYIGTQLGEPQLTTEFNTLLDLAAARDIPTLAKHRENAKTFGGGVEDKRARYMSLLQDLQADFVETRFNRRLRGETSDRLFQLGLASFGISLLALAVYLWEWGGTGAAAKTCADTAGRELLLLPVVAAFGVLGAYFSRLMSFQVNRTKIGFEDVSNDYQMRALLVRLLYGMIGAIIFYYVLRSRLVDGTAFPNLRLIQFGEEVANEVPGLTPFAEVAKLIVWSFIAGFSERLMSNTLQTVEGRASDTKKPEPPKPESP